jgi:hypothetical protein
LPLLGLLKDNTIGYKKRRGKKVLFLGEKGPQKEGLFGESN